jgi:ParB/RepB/Spo0J family partition protein
MPRPRRSRGVVQLEAFPELVTDEPPTLERINPRDVFGVEDVYVSTALRESIRRNGILVPPLVRFDGARCRIIDGRRRVRAAVDLMLPDIPAIVVPVTHRSEAAVATLSANMLRTYNVVSELEAIEQLMTDVPGINPDEIADRLNVSRRVVQNRIRLFGLIPSLRTSLEQRRLGLAAAVVAAGRPIVQQQALVERLAHNASYRPTARSLRDLWDIAHPATHQVSMEFDTGWAAAVAICDQLIQSVPEPGTTPDPDHVRDIMYRINEVAELLYAMTG